MNLKDILEEQANDFLIEGVRIKKDNVDLARSYLSYSWALNAYLGRNDFTALNHKLLMSTGLTTYGAESYEKHIFAKTENMIATMKSLPKRF